MTVKKSIFGAVWGALGAVRGALGAVRGAKKNFKKSGNPHKQDVSAIFKKSKNVIIDY